MSKKLNLQDVLQSADMETVEKIAENYTSVDGETSRRMYERCVQKMMMKMDENSGYTEVFTAERHKRRSFLKMAGLSAACIAVVGGVFWGLRSVKAPEPNSIDEPPVFFEQTTLTTTVTSVSGTTATAESAANKTTSAATVKAVTTETSTLSAEKNTTTASTVKNADISTKNAESGNTRKQSAETTAKITVTTTKTEYTGTFKPDITTITTTVTTIPQDERDRLLAELDRKEEVTFATYPRKRQVILGNLPSDAPRVSYEEVKQLAAETETISEFEVELARRYPYPDKIWGSGVDHHQYWINEDGTEYIEFVYDHRTSASYHNGDVTKAVFLAPQLRRMEEIRAEEAEKGGKMIRERAKVLGNISENKKHLSLEEIRSFALDPMTMHEDDFAGFWKRLNSVEPYPDIWMDGEGLCLICGIYGTEDYLMVYPESGTAEYRKYDDPDFSETIISGRGTASDDDIQRIIRRMTYVIQVCD